MRNELPCGADQGTRRLRHLSPRAALAGLALFAATAAGAATITVNSLVDVVNIGAPDGQCTLREAMFNAEANGQPNADCAAGSGKDTIVFAVDGTITLNGTLPTSVTELSDPAGLTIDGTGRAITLQGSAGGGRAIEVGTQSKLRLVGLTVRGFFAQAVSVSGGQLDIERCVFSDNGNSASSVVFGKAIYLRAGATANVESSTFSNNVAPLSSSGGAIANDNSNLSIANSTFVANRAGFLGGGAILSNGASASTRIVNSTFTGNLADGGGSAVRNVDSTVTLVSSTVAGNNNGTGVPAIDNANSGSFTLTNTIVANNAGGDCSNSSGGIVNATGVNLVKDGSCGVPNPQNLDPNLGSLVDNGGPTETMQLLAGSPAIDAANDGSCPPPAADQRGVARPQGSFCDIGAYEVYQSVLPPTHPMASVIMNFDYAVLQGQIVGAGPGKSAPHRLRAFRNQLVTAAAYIDQNQVPQACSQLKASLKRIYVSGKLQAWHFVKGTTQPLVDEINGVSAQLGCGAP